MKAVHDFFLPCGSYCSFECDIDQAKLADGSEANAFCMQTGPDGLTSTNAFIDALAETNGCTVREDGGGLHYTATAGWC